MNLSKSEIANARRLNLRDFLVRQGYTLHNEGSGNFRVLGFQGLIVKENYWYRHSTKEYGNAIDFIMKFEDLSFPGAIAKLLNIQNRHDLVSWQFDENTDCIEKYLVENRKIDHDIVRQLITLNKIKQDKAKCVCFLEYNDEDNLAYIFRRSTTSANIFKGEVKHSSKSNSFQITMKNNSILAKYKCIKVDKLYIVEGAIDACAMATLLKMKFLKNDIIIKIITTAGYPHPSLKSRIEKDNPSEIIIATDMDEQGRKLTNIIKSMIKINSVSIPQYNAKDPAELLIKIKTKNK